MITKDITKDLKELKINGENIDFLEAFARLMENTTKAQVNFTESINVIEWIWGVVVKVNYHSDFDTRETLDVRMVTKDDEIIEGEAILDSIAIDSSNDMHIEELFLKGVSTLEGFNTKISK
ncbi:hypothetical protein [Bacillus cereus]|uniref:hypothetical protein n=1 Tax=Bacillus cereus TaxID=1396 RepID=UPI000BF354DA|nr:hypothetical protein [Bacillus cereus]PER25423.1 hypothetical protein CN476_12795 [Bacillus cereus]